jgi:hypothetical protein
VMAEIRGAEGDRRDAQLCDDGEVPVIWAGGVVSQVGDYILGLWCGKGRRRWIKVGICR